MTIPVDDYDVLLTHFVVEIPNGPTTIGRVLVLGTDSVSVEAMRSPIG